MANRIPLVLEAGRTQQHQPDDTLQLRTDAASGAAKLLLIATDNGEATCFEIRVYDDALLNMAFGVNAGAGLTTGSQNICIGASAGAALTTGINNTAIGFQALQDLSGAFNSNTAIGPNTMRELNAASGGGQNNTAIGPSAMRDLLTGSNNVAIGTSSMLVATDADMNTFIGQGSGGLLTTGDSNVGIGVNACRSITTGGTNSFVGNAAGNNVSQKVDAANSTGIGNGTFTTADNQVMIGNASVTQEILRGTVDIVRSTNACRLNVYNTAAADPPGTNYELVHIRWATNVARIGTEAGAGGGTVRDLAFDRGTAEYMIFTSAGVIFNDAGTSGQHFRVESDTLSHVFYVEAGAGNIALFANAAPNFQSMGGGAFLATAAADPSDSPTGGVFVYVGSGDGILKVRDSGGAVTLISGETRGATASVADGGTITHNLGAAPSGVLATGSVAGEIVSVTALGATTFTVAIKLHDGTAGTSQTIYWKAWK